MKPRMADVLAEVEKLRLLCIEHERRIMDLETALATVKARITIQPPKKNT